jgi:D-alanine transaminase
MKTLATFNGQIQPLEHLKISANDRAFYFADAVYEVVRIYSGKLFLFAEHLSRLGRSLASLGIKCDLSLVEKDIMENVNANKIFDGYVYVQVSRGEAPRAHQIPKNLKPNVTIYSVEFVSDPFAPFRASGIKASLHPDWRWKRRDIKSTNLLANCIARDRAESENCQEAILYEEDDFAITECSSNNVFIVSSNTLRTPPVSNRILNGITRQCVLAIAKSLNIEAVEENFTVSELKFADEVLITGSFAEVLGVVSVAGCTIGDGSVGPVTRMISESFQDLKKASH